MRIIMRTGFIHVLPNDDVDTDMLMGWRQKKHDPWIIAEDNVINRMVLGLPYNVVKEHTLPEYTDTLKEFQVADVNKMMGLSDFLNANPMGLGKTPETVRYLKEMHAKNALIVTPKIVRYQWKDQLKTWGNFDAEIFEKQMSVPKGFWIINYEKLRNESTRIKFKNFQWQFLILDEAHKIKNRTSQQTLAVKDLPAAHRIALTGTPILRYVDDLWSILHFLDVRYSGKSYWTFVDYFCEIQQNPWGNKIVGLTKNPARVAMLNALLELISVRNNVNVAQGKIYEVIKVPMSKEQRTLYKNEKNLVLDSLPENCSISNGITLTLRLMQTTSWPGLFLEGMPGPKFEWILEKCKNNPGEKIVVFSIFEKTVSALMDYLKSNKVGATSITGKFTTVENDQHKKQFLTSKNVQVLAGTIGAMGQGYDGLQTVSHIIVFIDRDWSPEIMKQAEDRLNRMGQQNLVTVYYLECNASFDQYVGKINRNKANDIREALNDVED